MCACVCVCVCEQCVCVCVCVYCIILFLRYLPQLNEGLDVFAAVMTMSRLEKGQTYFLLLQTYFLLLCY